MTIVTIEASLVDPVERELDLVSDRTWGKRPIRAQSAPQFGVRLPPLAEERTPDATSG